MKVIVSPSNISGSLIAPASKSAMQRACALALINPGETRLHNPGISNDDLAALDVIQKMGASVTKMGENTLLIRGSDGNAVSPILNCGESGLGIRMFTPLAALRSEPVTITGTGSLMTRPMNFFDKVFPLLHIDIKSNNGKLPLYIKGPLIPANIAIDGSLSSQFLTGLLIAFASSCTQPVEIEVKDLKSRPYIDLTLQMMDHFGWHVHHDDYKIFYFTPGQNKEINIVYSVEGDWSGGSFLLVAGAIAGNINITGLDINSTQADKKVMEALNSCGAVITVSDQAIDISPGKLTAFDFDATDCPDLFPPLVALASFCSGTTKIKGVSRLKYKESDRGATLCEEFSKLGVPVSMEGDIMYITGVEMVRSTSVDSHHDHRIAMACAVAALKATGPVEIANAEAINKSYPEFFNDLVSIKTTLQIL